MKDKEEIPQKRKKEKKTILGRKKTLQGTTIKTPPDLPLE